MSSITDKPIASIKDDLLKVEKYSDALGAFIEKADTPITIGLQGEWGTGKTSLMALLLEKFNEKNIACSWVNTWEYSMFRGAQETTPNVLKGMLEKLKISCGEHWTLKDEGVEKFKKATKFFGNLANQVIAKQTGLDLQGAASGTGETVKAVAEIAEAKKLISSLIQELISDNKNQYNKVVFFVDDLDRIPPGDAVEILEALKNIFDIPNCVFVLAIDYDVVVKGLESKFGPKTEQNEREFRSFFDKIIQVPFSMPTGVYDIESFLVSKLKDLGVDINDDEKELYTKTVRNSIGYNPRSLKRYLNSFSLINHLRNNNFDENDNDSCDDYMLFAILGIQISYPRVFRLLTQKPNFTTWDKGFANKQGIEWDIIQDKIQKFGESELIDEEWEQVLWGACQVDPYLKSRAFSVAELFNLIRQKFENSLEEEMEAALTFAAITSVDDDIDTKQAVQKVGNKTIYNGIENKIIQLKEEGYDEAAVQNWATFWSILAEKEKANSKQRVSLAKSGCGFYDDSKGGRGKNQMFYTWNPSKKLQGVKVFMQRHTGIVKKAYEELNNKYNINDEAYIYIGKEKNLILEPILYEKLGENQYRSLLSDVANMID